MTRILLTGRTGQVGAELISALAALGELNALDRTQLDLSDGAAIARTVRALAPNIIVNAAAYTAVDRAEVEPDLAMAINGDAPGVLAQEAARLGAWLVHYSTDYVFDGYKAGAYAEDDPPHPLNIYGRTKLAGELAIQAAGARHLILRTSWVYGASGKNFLVTIKRLAAERPELKIVNNQFGAPTWCHDIAQVTAAMLRQIAETPDGQAAALSGIYNATAEGVCSWYEFATAILAESRAGEAQAKLIPIPASEYATPARRPSNSVLSHDKLRRLFGLEMPHWRQSLKKCLKGQ